jgi:hypothetical protein
MVGLFYTFRLVPIHDSAAGTILVSGKILWQVKACCFSGSPDKLSDLTNKGVRKGVFYIGFKYERHREIEQGARVPAGHGWHLLPG